MTKSSKKNLLQKYQSRFFYLRLSILSLLFSIIVVSTLGDNHLNVESGSISAATTAVFGGFAIWLMIVSFPKPFSQKDYKTPIREMVLQERFKTVLMILMVSSILFILHIRNNPPFPKIGSMFLFGGLLWAHIVMWPETKRNWRKDLRRWKNEKWKGWRIGP